MVINAGWLTFVTDECDAEILEHFVDDGEFLVVSQNFHLGVFECQIFRIENSVDDVDDTIAGSHDF